MAIFATMLKIGILGGGQLGRMLLQAAANYPVETHILENDPACPSAHLCHQFTKGSILNFEDVYNFGKGLDVLTIEIENVNIEALEKLEQEGKKIVPNTHVLKTIRNKILQKEFYQKNEIPTADFLVTNSKAELLKHTSFIPAVHKIGEGGYDGKGVQLIKNDADMQLGFDAPAVLEKMIDVKEEVALIVACDGNGAMAFYPPVQMHFDPVLNLLDYQICPAPLSENSNKKLREIAKKLVEEFRSPGLFAIEFLIDKSGDIFVNETAPRVHNSGHHTIEAHYSSQFDMLWRILIGAPLGNPNAISPSVLINIIGTQNGEPSYSSLSKILSIPNVFVHLYGKKQVKPGRKMGHINLLGSQKEQLLEKVETIKVFLPDLC
jgi:5-(carboxyamino)imidazole ribonucleotide synthase